MSPPGTSRAARRGSCCSWSAWRRRLPSPFTSLVWHVGRCGRRSPSPRRREFLMPEMLSVQPYDMHNQLLVSNVHPPDWANPEPAGRYNLVVVGAGTAGLISAVGAVGLGGRVALVERSFLGGDCLNVGCVPSKALIRASRAAAEVQGAQDYGV